MANDAHNMAGELSLLPQQSINRECNVSFQKHFSGLILICRWMTSLIPYTHTPTDLHTFRLSSTHTCFTAFHMRFKSHKLSSWGPILLTCIVTEKAVFSDICFALRHSSCATKGLGRPVQTCRPWRRLAAAVLTGAKRVRTQEVGIHRPPTGDDAFTHRLRYRTSVRVVRWLT